MVPNRRQGRHLAGILQEGVDAGHLYKNFLRISMQYVRMPNPGSHHHAPKSLRCTVPGPLASSTGCQPIITGLFRKMLHPDEPNSTTVIPRRNQPSRYVRIVLNRPQSSPIVPNQWAYPRWITGRFPFLREMPAVNGNITNWVQGWENSKS